MSASIKDKVFTNADQEIVPYDGSPIAWRVSAYAVVIRDRKILIIKNKLEKLYDVIGGGIEFGETIEEALSREAMEEGGANIKIGKLLHAQVGWFHHRNGSYHQTLQLFYTATIIGDLQEPTEEDIAWRDFIPLKEIGNTYPLPPIVEKVIKSLS